VSSYTTTDGRQHAMADVWFAKDAAAAPQISELLAAPSTEVLSAAAPSAAISGPASTHAVSPTAIHLFSDTRPAPLI
jgi:trimeric autotransporter adhesin